MTDPIRFQVGDPVIITDGSLANIRTDNRNRTAGRGYTSDSLFEMAQAIHAEGIVGIVTHVFPPGYDVSASFPGKGGMHMKGHFLEKGPVDARPDVDRLSELSDAIVAAMKQGKTPSLEVLAATIGAIRHAVDNPPTVLLETNEGITEVTASDGRVRVVIADMDIQDPIADEDVDTILAGGFTTPDPEALREALEEVRADLSSIGRDQPAP